MDQHTKILIQNFNHTVDIWIKELDKYHFHTIRIKPSPDTWSMGQVYMHLIADTKFYLSQIEYCIASNNHATEEATPQGKIMLQNNDFPNEILEGAPENRYLPQPFDTGQLRNDLLSLRSAMNKFAEVISQSSFKGKAKHPGLGFFSAHEWLQFADMHFRHHLRQKKRIDDFLSGPAKLNEQLMDAIEMHDLKTVKALLAEGADANYTRYPDVDEPNGYMQPTTPLRLVMFCISDCLLKENDLEQFAEIAKVLLQHGADPQPAMKIAEARYGEYDPGFTGGFFAEVWHIIARHTR